MSRSDSIDGARPALPESAALVPALAVGAPVALAFVVNVWGVGYRLLED